MFLNKIRREQKGTKLVKLELVTHRLKPIVWAMLEWMRDALDTIASFELM